MSVYNQIHAHVRDSKIDKFSIKFLCDLFETTSGVVKEAFEPMTKHHQLYRVHVHDFFVEVER